MNQPRTAILFETNHNGTRPKDLLKQMTVGHQYYRQHLEKLKSCQYMKLNPGRFQVMCERPDVQYGKVVQVHVLRADNCPFPEMSLKDLATKRLRMREDPLTIPDLTTYIKFRKSWWFLEETEDGQFRCDYPIGHKGKVCKHELALNYLHKRIEVLPHAAAARSTATADTKWDAVTQLTQHAGQVGLGARPRLQLQLACVHLSSWWVR